MKDIAALPMTIAQSVAQVLADAERLSAIVPTFDPANGDMILAVRIETSLRSFRISPELGANFRDLIFRAVRQRAN